MQNFFLENPHHTTSERPGMPAGVTMATFNVQFLSGWVALNKLPKPLCPQFPHVSHEDIIPILQYCYWEKYMYKIPRIVYPISIST